MDKDFIMKLDDEKDLLDKEKTILGLARHPIPFPPYRTVLSDRTHFMQMVYENMKAYIGREFEITLFSYGLEVSINYDQGHFVSMILKGTGTQGERIRDDVALQFMPQEAKNKNKITLHGTLTLFDPQRFRGGTDKHEVPLILKHAFSQGISPREGKEIVCRPHTLYIDGKRTDVMDAWGEINSFTITGLSSSGDYEHIEKWVEDEVYDIEQWMVPHCGFIVADASPDDEGAFPLTHFIIDDSITP